MAANNNSNVTFEIKRHCGVIDENPKSGWKRELNVVSWNGGEPKFDIREWSPDHTRMTKGLTLTYDQAAKLADILRVSL